LCALFFCLFMGQLMLIVLKPIIGRGRPYMVLDSGIHIFNHFNFNNDYYSFPSGHTINIMIISGMLSLRYPKKSMLILCCGLFLSFIRVVNVVHFLSDWFFTAYLSLVLIPISRAFIGLFSKFKWTRPIELGFEEIQ
jgi:membrane-associated phospholipid phosphatase